ncbi:MAG: CRISPR-associated helicase Cas3' [Bacteroidetes bacterium]|nr:CRISPR-associated helicase Cas3' [Bacteroidota bacterium]
MKAIKEVFLNDVLPLEKILQNYSRYFAHTKNDNFSESLSKHSSLVMEYFLSLCSTNNIELVVDGLINSFTENNSFQEKELSKDIIKRMFVESIYYHDFGKVNENFQRVKMQNSRFFKVDNGIDSQHSILSSYLFLANWFDEIYKLNLSDEDKFFWSFLSFLFAYNISKHHGYIEDGKGLVFDEEIITRLSNYFDILINLQSVNKSNFQNYIKSKKKIMDFFSNINSSFELFTLLKLNSSLLTASDYYATNEFMIGLKCEDFGVMDEELKEKIITNTYQISYNKSLLANFDYYNSLETSELQDFSNSNLNLLRQKLSAEVASNIRNNITQKLFYIEAPTGSGKTNLSLLALSEILKQRKNITKVFYVFPFTTLITQTHKYFTDNLKLNNSEIAEIHSKSPFNKKSDNDAENDAQYGSDRKNYIDNLFVNYPISLISHIKFFDILTSNEKEANYLLHRLANSVVIIDEIHSYNPTEWDKVNYLIQKYSEFFNITFIVMSATLPKISRLLFDSSGISQDNFVYLVKNKQEYFSNLNFKNRVQFRFDYLEEEFSLERLTDIVHKHSEEYFIKHTSVKAIVEFVTKITAQKFYEKVVSDERYCDYEIIPITGTILEPRRKEVINFLKSDESDNLKVVVICTQVIEAGLDIDMDIGFKDKAIVDSEEQLAGRINRNALKKNSELFIFNSADSKKTYRSDLRHKQKIDIADYKSILLNKDFDLFYSKVFEIINKDNSNPYLANNLSDFTSQIKSLRFSEVKQKFQLIKDTTISVFVPCDISKRHFTPYEIKFIKTFNNEVCQQNTIDGEIVWDIYDSIITNKGKSFIDRKIDLRMIASIISKFIFSIWRNQNIINLLLHSGEDKYGFIKLFKDQYQEIYTYETGLKSDLETDCNFL